MNSQNYLSYFAAANGYSGFRSYFHEVFKSEEFSKIYVIKGGPGTGKSSFMKRLLREKTEYVEEAIYCSSDISSLDGVILSAEGGRIALIDGTAPHTRDAEIPGAIDEILNFGDFWDSRWLVAKREEIISLTREKSKAYKTAYRYLSLAGEMKQLNSHHKPKLDGNKIAELIGEVKRSGEYKKSIRLVSAFGKSGLVRLATPTDRAKRVIEIRGEEKAMLLCNRIADYLADNSVSHTSCPYALDGTLTESVYIPSTDTALVCYRAEGVNPSKVIEAADFFPAPDRADTERERVAYEYSDEMMSEAKRWFSVASELHFELEAIYSATMNYGLVNSLYDKIHSEILNILKS